MCYVPSVYAGITPLFSDSKMRAAMKTLKSEKGTGPDNSHPELSINVGECTSKWLQQLRHSMVDTQNLEKSKCCRYPEDEQAE